MGLLGPNGAGKTTTMRLVTGFLYPDSGDVIIDGQSVLEDPVSVQSQIGYLPENNPLYKDLLASEFLALAADLKSIPRDEISAATDFVVKAVGLADVYHRPIRELSKGYKQRLGIAIALLGNPKLLILDEPTEGLDPNQRREIRQLLKKLSKDHTVIISTHVMQEVEAFCTRVVVINKGKKVADGSVAELSRGAKNEKSRTVVLEGKAISKSLKGLKDIKELDVQKLDSKKYTVRLVVAANKPIQPELSKLVAKNGWTIWSMIEEKQHLEDVFRDLTL